MFKVQNLINEDRVSIVDSKGAFKIIEHKKDLSVNPLAAEASYFASKMGVRKRQVICNIKESPITLQSGAMQWTIGNVESTTGVKGVGDLFGKMVSSKVTKESTIKPEYHGTGILVTEPTYKHLILLDVANEFGSSVVLDDGLFLACEASLRNKVIARSNLSSALAGGEGLFNLSLNGDGIAVLECDCPREELVEITMENDVCKIDGNFAIAWSSSLDFTVERSSKSLIGSAVNGEGLVNVYRGTGKILMMPLRDTNFYTLPVTRTNV